MQKANSWRIPEYKTHKIQDLSWRSDILESDLAHPLPAKQAQKNINIKL